MRAIGQVVASLVAGVGVIYAVGGLVIWLRLLLGGKPQLAVVAELPREVVISVGLVVVLLAVATGGFYAVWRLLLSPRDEKPPGEGPTQEIASTADQADGAWRPVVSAWARRVMSVWWRGALFIAPACGVILFSAVTSAGWFDEELWPPAAWVMAGLVALGF